MILFAVGKKIFGPFLRAKLIMLGFLKGCAFSRYNILRAGSKCRPIGIDISEDTVKMAQFVDNAKGVALMAGGIETRPSYIEPASAEWQRWAIKAIRNMIAENKFHGRAVVAAMPKYEVFIEHIKMPRADASQNKRQEQSDSGLYEAVLAKMKQKLPFDPANAVMKYIPTGEENLLVMASDKEKINRHLAIYEKAALQIHSISVWPSRW